MITIAEINLISLQLKVAAFREYLKRNEHRVHMSNSYGEWACEALFVRKEQDGQFSQAVYHQYPDGTYGEIMVDDADDRLVVSAYRESDKGIHLAYKAELNWF